jgi:hypothetical protein
MPDDFGFFGGMIPEMAVNGKLRPSAFERLVGVSDSPPGHKEARFRI